MSSGKRQPSCHGLNMLLKKKKEKRNNNNKDKEQTNIYLPEVWQNDVILEMMF